MFTSVFCRLELYNKDRKTQKDLLANPNKGLLAFTYHIRQIWTPERTLERTSNDPDY